MLGRIRVVALQLPASHHFFIEIRVLQLDVLDEAALRSVAALTPLSRALEGFLYLISSPAVTLLFLWSLFTHLVFELFLCLFLATKRLTS